MVITKEISQFLENAMFITVGTCDLDGKPNVAPKLLLKVDDDCVYTVDFVIGRTWQNIKINPRVSLAIVNMDTLVGYQINGPAEIIAKGAEYTILLKEYQQKQIQFSATRIIEGLQRQKKHESFEVAFPERIVVFKIKAEEVVEIVPTGGIKRKRSHD